MLEREARRLAGYDPGKFRRRFGILLWVVSIALSVLVVRMWYLQAIKGDALRQRSENNRIRLREVKPLKGLVKDAMGNVLVDNQASFDISVVPEDAKDVKGIFSNKYGKHGGPVLVCEKADRDPLLIEVEGGSLADMTYQSKD